MLFSVISQHCTWCITAGCQYLFGLVHDLSEERTISKISCTTMSFKAIVQLTKTKCIMKLKDFFTLFIGP